MNRLRQGLVAGLLAAAIVAGLSLVDVREPGHGLYTVSSWFGLNIGGQGRPLGILILLIIGSLLGLLFAVIQGERLKTFVHYLLLGLAMGLLFWLIGPFVLGTFVQGMHLTFGSFLSWFIPLMLFGSLLGIISFQRSTQTPK